jgi:hypothetical protein
VVARDTQLFLNALLQPGFCLKPIRNLISASFLPKKVCGFCHSPLGRQVRPWAICIVL